MVSQNVRKMKLFLTMAFVKELLVALSKILSVIFLEGTPTSYRILVHNTWHGFLTHKIMSKTQDIVFISNKYNIHQLLTDKINLCSCSAHKGLEEIIPAYH